MIKIQISLLILQRNLQLLLIFLLLNCLSQGVNAQQLAFPTAYGAGAYTTGGRGGKVVHVINLNDNGVGSLRWALKDASNKGVPRTIVFDVSGIIELQSDIRLSNMPGDEGGYADGISILGQSAPEGGITIVGAKLRIYGINQVIARYLKFRSTANYDGCFALGEADNFIFDHLSGSNTPDIVFSVPGNLFPGTDHTIQNCLMAQSKNGLIVGDSSAETNGSYGSVSVLRNAYYNVGWRTPMKMGGSMEIDAINNLVHNWKYRSIRADAHNYSLNHIGNYYQSGRGSKNRLHTSYVVAGVTPQIYNEDNFISENVRPVGYDIDESFGWHEFQVDDYVTPLPSEYFASSILPIRGRAIPILSSSNVKENVLPLVGASQYIKDDGTLGFYRDIYDTEHVNGIEIDSDTGTVIDLVLPVQSISNNRPAGFYNLAKSPDIPEVWFDSHMTIGDLASDIAASGYTYLEDYLNQVDGPPSVAISVESIEVSPNTYELTVPETTTLIATVSPDNATNQNGVWSSSDESIATVDSNGLVTSISQGIVTITFTTIDGGFTDTSEITVFPEALQASAGSDQQICEGESATLTASGGTSYVWNNGETTAIIEVTPNATTIYTVTVSDDNGQSEDASVTITVNEIPIAFAGEDQTICLGESITLTATGGTSYLWSTGETTASIDVNPIIETTYDVEVISNNCSSTDSVIVFVTDAPDIAITDDVVIIEGNSTTLTANGGETYEWSTGEITESINVSPTVTTQYTVSSLGVNGCTGAAQVTVTVIPEIIVNAGEDVTICNGDTVTLTASGGVTYTWDTGDTGSELTINPPITTTYTVTAEDNYGYTDTDSVTIIVNEIPSITVNDEIYIMIGNSATLTANGGDSYSWSTGETVDSITVNPNVTTTYTVTGFSANGCQSSVEVLVTVVDVLNANAGEDISICLGESIALNASGGITYTWGTGAVGHAPIVSPVETTTYTVTVTDGFGNSDSDNVTVTVNPVPTAIASEDQIICNGETVTLTSEGGDAYLWSTGDTTSTITVNPNIDTIYTVEVFSNSCSDTDEVTITVLPTPEVNISDDIVIITGNSTTLEVSGGDSYAWNTGETTNTLEVSPTETTTYSVTAFLDNGCQSTAQVTVTVIPEVDANAGNDVAICSGESVTLNASGGVTFTWNTGGTGPSPTFSPNVTTTYTVTVTDQYGNTDSDSVTITVNELPNITASDDITINDGETTTLVVNGAESYLWDTGETTSSISVTPSESTTYIVTGFSANGCQSEEEIIVTVIPELEANAGNDVTICYGESITLNASGGITYTWNTGETSASPTFTPSTTTTYTVTVTDGYGNSDSDSVTISVNQLPNVTVSDSITIIEGETTNLVVSGAESYLWNTGETSNTITVSPTQTTTYTVAGTTNSCSVEAQVTVIVEELFIASAGEDESICDNETYEIVLTANQGDIYLWNTGETTQSIVVSPLSTSTYIVTVTQGEQEDTDEVTVYVDPSPEVVIANGDSVDILNGDFVTLSASGANTYEWNNGATQPNIAVSPSVTTTYEVKGYIGDCFDEKQVTVNVFQPVVADAGEDVYICLNDIVTLTASGGDEYVWSTGEITPTILVSPTETTYYTVTVFNALDFDEASVTVDVDVNCEEDEIAPIDDDLNFSFDIFPNPANDIVNVKVSGGALIISYVHIYNLSGKLVHSTKISNQDLNPSTTRRIDVSSLQTGVYFVKLIDMNREITKKLIIN